MDNFSPQFQSYQGLNKIIEGKSAFHNTLKEFVEWSRMNIKLVKANEKYHSIKFLDTFFSDSLDVDVMSTIFSFSLENDYPVKVLILDPYSKFAISRIDALQQTSSAVEEINIALFNIRNAINSSLGKHEIKEKAKFSEGSFIEEQLDLIKRTSENFQIDIRFYDVLTEAPIYIISQFLAKGLIMHRNSAALNPWMVFVDDMSQKRDIYHQCSPT